MKHYLLLFLLPLQLFGAPWCIFSGHEKDPADFANFKTIVLDPQDHPDLDPFFEMEKELIAYINLGEIGVHSSLLEGTPSSELLVEELAHFPGYYIVDIRHPVWKKVILEKVIPKIVAQGFSGLYLDSLDSPMNLELKDPDYQGMHDACAYLVNAIKHAYPHLKLLLKGAYSIVPYVTHSIDGVVGESLYTTFNIAKKKYEVVPAREYEAQKLKLREAKKIAPHLEIYTLDLCDPSDVAMVQRIYKIEHQNGFNPYVTSFWLNDLVEEP